MPIVELGEPVRITGDVRIHFEGDGPARFVLEHGRDGRDGIEWGGSVTQISDGSKPEIKVRNGMEVAEFIDRIDGDSVATYRRHNADWLRIVPRRDDEESKSQCRNYTLHITPVGP